ncbi:LacI family DNA-binding transcriptional regulator [Micropruina sp.]|uniref:LacI family DNA-binding transcriptional regulator n=1 Tax=Micropruina sp. TaxID=2737536 RepID=UPI002616A3F5|nr:LacI family DNA-binding transcriptional regulator [Micropruina sp.]
MTGQPDAPKRVQRTRLADVAALAGVSVATASRSLGDSEKVSPQTRRRVIEAARELSYGAVAQQDAVTAGPRRTVAIIVPFVTRWFFAEATVAALDVLRGGGYDVLLYHLGDATARDDFFSRMPLESRVDGILSLSMPLTEVHTLALRALGLPLVSIGSHIDGFPSVGIDEEATARLAVTHLLNQGHRRIGLIAGRPDDTRFDFTASMSRRLGYEDALASFGLGFDPQLVVEGPHGLDGGAMAMTELLTRPDLPSAVFAEFDELAVGALWALRRAGLRVPQDVSVVGIDNADMAEFVDLTTVAQDVGAQGRAAARMLRQLLGDEPGTPAAETVLHPVQLLLRGTTCPPASRRRTPVSAGEGAADWGQSDPPEPESGRRA